MKPLSPIVVSLLLRAAFSPRQRNQGQNQSSAVSREGIQNVGVDEFQKLAVDKKNIVLDIAHAEEFAAGISPAR